MSIVSACPRQIEVHICVGRHGNFGFVGCRSNRCMGLSTCAGDVGRPRLLRESGGRPRIPSRGPRREGKPCPDLPVTDEPHLTAKNSTAAGRKDAHRCKSFLTLPRVLSVLAAECRIFKLSGKMHFCCRSNGQAERRAISRARSSLLLDWLSSRDAGLSYRQSSNHLAPQNSLLPASVAVSLAPDVAINQPNLTFEKAYECGLRFHKLAMLTSN